VKTYKGLKIPDGENAKKVFSEGHNDKHASCDGCGPCEKLGCANGRLTCGECLFYSGHRHIFKEYLNEGGKDVSEFKVGDRVETIKSYSGVKANQQGTIKAFYPDETKNPGIEFDIPFDGHSCSGQCEEGRGHWVPASNLKLINRSTKTQTTKENNMNVNSTVAKVFKDVDDAILVTKYLGGEYEEGNHRAYLDLKANDKLVLAEAKRIEKEEKDK
jgi:hypothetical protein